MKRLTLNETWELCVDGMWKWIAKQRRKSREQYTTALKAKWSKKYFPGVSIEHLCFFCEYDKQRRRGFDLGCAHCPARKVDRKLGQFWCEDGQYEETGTSWYRRPVAFYEQLVQLKRIYEKGKK